MCSASSSESWQPPPAPATATAGARDWTRAPDVVAVWVLLDVLWRHDPAQRRTVPDGLDLTGRAKGFLDRDSWRRCGCCGVWVGSVTFELRYADGRERRLICRNQMVHQHALEPRRDNQPI